MSKPRETPSGKIRVQIPGYAWLDALQESFIADNEGWFEHRVSDHSRHGQLSYYVAIVDPVIATMLASRLEARAALTLGQSGWALRRAAIRIEADVAVLSQERGWP